MLFSVGSFLPKFIIFSLGFAQTPVLQSENSFLDISEKLCGPCTGPWKELQIQMTSFKKIEITRGSTSGIKIFAKGSAIENIWLDSLENTFVIKDNPTKKDDEASALKVSVPNWSIWASLEDGEIKIQGGTQSLHIVSGKADIKIENTSGAMDIIAANINTTLGAVVGSLRLKQYEGQIKIQSLKGDHNLYIHNAIVQMNNITGDGVFFADRGKVFLQNYNGQLAGNFDQAALDIKNFEGKLEHTSVTGNISLAPDRGDYHVDTQSGHISLHLPSAVPHLLDLVSKDGDVFLPSPLKPKRSPAGVVRFKGKSNSDNDSVISLRAKSMTGNISVKNH